MSIMSFIFAIIGLIIFLKLIALPFKLIIRFVINSIIGGIILWILAFFGIFVVLNWWTIVLTGLLGVPGLVIAVLITMFI